MEVEGWRRTTCSVNELKAAPQGGEAAGLAPGLQLIMWPPGERTAQVAAPSRRLRV